MADINNESDIESDDFVQHFSGSKILPGSSPHSHCYAGHQFGVFAGQLGDGTVCYLGEVLKNGHKTEIQLKGSGLTPFSRSADGKKVLRSSIREFLASEHMHSLGVPTTRSGSLITSFETLVMRHDATRQISPKSASDQVEGRSAVSHEPAAVISRMAPSFIRFGSFEVVKRDPCPYTKKVGPSSGSKD